MLAQLISLSGSHNIVLDKPIILIGRHPECDVQIDSRKISRRHCCIAQVGEYLVVRDLGSTNGVRINGERVVEGTLRETDELIIGNQAYRVTWQESAATPARSSADGQKEKAAEEPVLDAIILEADDRPLSILEPKSKAPKSSRIRNRKPNPSGSSKLD